MGDDDDIAASLPRPPLPAPARRDAAIAAALRRFDGVGAPPAEAAEARREPRPAPWWSGPRRPYAGALAGAFLVAVIGLPWVWTSFDEQAAGGDRERPSVAATAGESAMADADIAVDFEPPQPQAGTNASDLADEAPDGAASAEVQPGPLPAFRESEPLAAKSEDPAPSAAAQDQLVVTGARIRRPGSEAALPATAVGEDRITAAGKRSPNAGAARRGDWNACTVEDPGRSLDRCRNSTATVSRGAPGRGAEHLADGLSRAWTGDLEGATAAFDRAIQAAPRSSAAYLNRGLAWRRRGDLDRALADLDRAVRYSPRDARAYYQRSLVLRQRGDLRRARADEESAVALDHRYAPLVKGGSNR